MPYSCSWKMSRPTQQPNALSQVNRSTATRLRRAMKATAQARGRREMETPRGKRQELQRNLGILGSKGIWRMGWHVGRGAHAEWAKADSKTWGKSIGVEGGLWKTPLILKVARTGEAARLGLGGRPSTDTQKSPKYFACSCQGQRRKRQRPAEETGLWSSSGGFLSSTQPEEPHGGSSVAHSCPAFNRKQQWNLSYHGNF